MDDPQPPVDEPDATEPDATEPDPAEPDPAEPDPAEPGWAEPGWARRRRLAAVFGDVLPETTGDERGPRDEDGDRGEEWLRRQVPPHHG
jgi:hypothetical protein